MTLASDVVQEVGNCALARYGSGLHSINRKLWTPKRVVARVYTAVSGILALKVHVGTLGGQLPAQLQMPRRGTQHAACFLRCDDCDTVGRAVEFQPVAAASHHAQGSVVPAIATHERAASALQRVCACRHGSGIYAHLTVTQHALQRMFHRGCPRRHR